MTRRGLLPVLKNLHSFKNIPSCHWWNPKELQRWKGWCSFKTSNGSLQGWVTEPCSSCSSHGKSIPCSSILLSWQGAESNQNILLLEALQKRICFLFNNLKAQAGHSQVSVGCANCHSPQMSWTKPMKSTGHLAVGSCKPETFQN